MFRQDYILRLIEELARAVARSLARAKEQNFARAQVELDEAEQRLGLFHGSERLDAQSLVKLLGDDKCVLYAQLLLTRADLAEQQHHAETRMALQQRARQLLLAAHPDVLADLKAELLSQVM